MPIPLLKDHQRHQNNLLKKIEHELSLVVDKAFKKQWDISLSDCQYYHVNCSSKTKLKTRRYAEICNGFTILIIPVKDADPLFIASTCSKADTYSKLVGRVTVLEYIESAITNGSLHGVDKIFNSFPLSENKYNEKTNRYIVNRYIYEYLGKNLRKKASPPARVNYIDKLTEQELQSAVLTLIGDRSYFPKSTTLSIVHQHYRAVRDPRTNQIHYATLDFLKARGFDSTVVLATSGITTTAVKFNTGSGQGFFIMSYSICSPSDVYSKAEGRKQTLKNIIRDKNCEFYTLNMEPTSRDVNSMLRIIIQDHLKIYLNG